MASSKKGQAVLPPLRTACQIPRFPGGAPLVGPLCGQVSRAGWYSDSERPKVQATPSRAVRVLGGTRSQ